MVTGTAVVIVMFAGPLSAMKTVIQDKSTQSLPFAMTVATFVNCRYPVLSYRYSAPPLLNPKFDFQHFTMYYVFNWSFE